MTPAARIETAIVCLDRIAAGEPAEKVLTGWARTARHAGSKDRAAVRDHVFDALRRWWSSAVWGGDQTGRARMIGLLRAEGIDPTTLFTGAGYGPDPLTETERASGTAPEGVDALDCPAWLAPQLRASLDQDFDPVMTALQSRAPVFLRANLVKGDRDSARSALLAEGIETLPHPLSPTALEVTTNPRRVQGSRAWADGLVELQDAASQAIVDLLPLDGTRRILDYCAGGGGKALAMAARTAATIHAHDADAARMRDLPVRAERAGVQIRTVAPGTLSDEDLYDLVLVDAPCSGSGAWRRSPEGKIRLTPQALDRLTALQDRVLCEAVRHVRPGGLLAYATCSLLDVENRARVDHFSAGRATEVVAERHLTPMDGGDGFYCALLRFNP
ncbi:RsmB/NOP family class I SAM-dependent RNA methyltransferase [Palleronia abyssalis]|uniref:Ribosomal RNA small subunit methyltransferase B n=1 Tax=Palleronia abyssalis TaxID=1501240 RepID=A0A2R8BRC6_9RHOB|nr:RsmB/NOP family class I SAM-dependent RNA methyltransferase [Palleronia abyssalis]SPJ22636.1 Ribosomal RNA small subunit methyltransferase B [Palleronia abyssalis]